jgi:hypothetical protein
MVTLEYLNTTAHFDASYTPLPSLVELSESQAAVTARERSITVLAVMLSTPSVPLAPGTTMSPTARVNKAAARRTVM